MTTGTERHAARMAAIDAANAIRYANTPPPKESRQVMRAAMRHWAKPGARPARGHYAPRDLTNRSILKVWQWGGREYAFHATKGLRIRSA